MESKEKALRLAKRKGYSNVQAIMHVGKGMYHVYSSSKKGNIELFVDVKNSIVKEVG